MLLSDFLQKIRGEAVSSKRCKLAPGAGKRSHLPRRHHSNDSPTLCFASQPTSFVLSLSLSVSLCPGFALPHSFPRAVRHTQANLCARWSGLHAVWHTSCHDCQPLAIDSLVICETWPWKLLLGHWNTSEQCTAFASSSWFTWIYKKQHLPKQKAWCFYRSTCAYGRSQPPGGQENTEHTRKIPTSIRPLWSLPGIDDLPQLWKWFCLRVNYLATSVHLDVHSTLAGVHRARLGAASVTPLLWCRLSDSKHTPLTR